MNLATVNPKYGLCVTSTQALQSRVSVATEKQNLYNAAFSINPAVDSAAYFIRVADNLPADTLTVVYTSQSVFISADCGSVYTNTISRAYCTKNTIDSIKVNDAAINLTGNENVRIYY